MCDILLKKSLKNFYAQINLMVNFLCPSIHPSGYATGSPPSTQTFYPPTGNADTNYWMLPLAPCQLYGTGLDEYIWLYGINSLLNDLSHLIMN